MENAEATPHHDYRETPPVRFFEPAEVVEALQNLPRTGWLQWGIENPETVYEHVVASRELAVRYQDKLELSDTELQDLLDILEIHDWPEALVGDEVVLGDETDANDRMSNKQVREIKAMEEICNGLKEGERILQLFIRYEEGKDRVARLAKQIEKLQAVLLAAEYEKRFAKPGLLAEFVQYTKEDIEEPFLQQELARVTEGITT